jgi:hypothetical protein
MFTNKTVFILGAGASWHYGYPTGEELVKTIISKSSATATFFSSSINRDNQHRPDYVARDTKGSSVSYEDIARDWINAANECSDLAQRLVEVSPLVIDYFLGQNEGLQAAGKLMIAWVILEREAQFLKAERRNTNRPVQGKDNWCRFVIHELVMNCKSSQDLLRNEVTFITFNYDVSLEEALYRGLGAIQLFKKGDVEKFLGNDRIIHVYGKVREFPPFDFEPIPLKLSNFETLDQIGFKELLNFVYAASRKLKVIAPDDKDTQEIIAARNAVEPAQRVYILGYGFDDNNSKRLGLQTKLRRDGSKKSVLFTNFGDINRVNKSASRLVFGNAAHFFPGSELVERGSGSYYEKSTRDVYQALELDFDALD